MEQLSGPITAAGIAAVAAILIQVAKTQWELTGRLSLLVSFVIAMVLFLPFHLIWGAAELSTAQHIYSSIFYSIVGWLIAAGMYSASKTAIFG
jgi:hypothetical protein